MESYPRGEPVKLELNSSDVSTAAAMTCYNINGTARTIGATERLLIWSLTIASAAAVTVDVITSGTAAAAGTRIATGYMAVNSSQGFQHSGEPLAIPVGATPKVKASGAGAVTVIAIGEIIKS